MISRGRPGLGRLALTATAGALLVAGVAGPAAAHDTAAGAAAAASSWPQFQGNAAHTGDEPGERSVSKANVSQLSPAWTATLPQDSESTEVVTAGGVVYVAGASDVTAYQAASGTQLWQVSLPGDVIQTPAIQGSLVLVAYDVVVGRRPEKGVVEALSTATGAAAWTRVTAVADVNSGVTVTARRAYVVVGGDHVEAIRPANGREIWVSPSLTGCSLSPPSASGNYVVLGVGGGGVAALNAADGTLAWQDTLGGGCGAADYNWLPAISQGTVYAGLLDGTDAINLATGAVIWQNDTVTAAFFGPALTSNDVIISSDGTTQLFALSRSDGSLQWQTHLPDSEGIVSPAVFGNLVWAVTDATGGGRVQIVALGPADGRKIFTTPGYADQSQGFPPTVAAGHLYFNTGSQVVALALPGSG
jgi:outer membrane protein assembly factor BamB